MNPRAFAREGDFSARRETGTDGRMDGGSRWLLWKGVLADCGQLALALATIREDSFVNKARAPFAFSLFFLPLAICSFRFPV